MIIHHVLSIVKLVTRAIISNVKINLVKMKYFDNDVSLSNEQFKGQMEEMEGRKIGTTTS